MEPCFFVRQGDDLSILLATVGVEAEVEMAWLGME